MLLLQKKIFKNPLISYLVDNITNIVDSNITIFMLHGVHDQSMEETGSPPNSSIHIDILRKALEIIKKKYHIISLDEATDILQNKIPWKKKCVVLTFDDSLKTQFTLALPLLNEFKVNASFFISTQVIEQYTPYWWRRLEYCIEHRKSEKMVLNNVLGEEVVISADNESSILRSLKSVARQSNLNDRTELIRRVESQLDAQIMDSIENDPFAKPLNWEEVIAMSNEGMIIGGHTVTHANLSQISEDGLRFEIKQSKKEIKDKAGIEVKHFAYPFGLYTTKTKQILKEYGFTSALTTDSPGWNNLSTGIYDLKRFSMPTNPYKIPYIINGCQQWVQRYYPFNKDDT